MSTPSFRASRPPGALSCNIPAGVLCALLITRLVLAADEVPNRRTVTAADLPPVPATEPAEALDTFQLAKGCRLELVAAEPLVAAPVDACSLSLNKGIGAPYGSMLCGSAELISKAREHHRVLGSHSVHKEGMFAAAAVVALETMIPRLAEDHVRARRLAELLSSLEGIYIDMDTVQTNIVRVEIECMKPSEFVGRVLARGAGVSELDASSVKFITHHGISDGDIDSVAAIVGDVLSEM